jgi:hypothetical protein
LRIDLLPPNLWEKECDLYRAALPIQASVVHIHASYTHALWEATHGLAKLFSHKKKIAILRGWEPAFDEIAQAFSSEEYDVLWISEEQLKNPGAWFEPIQSELLFVLLAIDDPVTGRECDTDAFDIFMKEKRVFKLVLSHAAHTFGFGKEKPGIYDVRVLSLRADRALVIAGDRFRVAPVLSPKLSWQSESNSNRAENLKTALSFNDPAENRKQILKFESHLPAGFLAYFAPNDRRVFDRVAIFHPEFDGSAVIDELALDFGLKVPALSFDGKFESASPCRWESPRLSEWLSARESSEERTRGLVILAPELISQGLELKLAAVAQRLRALQA